MKKITGSFPSTSGLCRCRFYMYIPEKPRAVVMLSHGMCEYAERYRAFAEFLNENGIAFCANDHIGHGDSTGGECELGYFGSSGGYIYMVRDLRRMRRIIDEKLPRIPRFLIGHSMGSFLARIYLSRYETKWDGVILMGTAGGLAGSAPLRKIIDGFDKLKGERFRPDFGKGMVFGMFNLRAADRRTPFDWLSRDEAGVDRFIADPKCNFSYTTAGYKDLLNALMSCNSPNIIENTPTDVPLLFMSGGMDPIGEYGAGVRSACLKYREHGCPVRIRVYPEARHELLFELNRRAVMRDILEFIDTGEISARK